MRRCATPAARRRSGSRSGGWRSLSATTSTAAVAAFADTPEARRSTGERAPPARVLAARLPACRTRAGAPRSARSSRRCATGSSSSRWPSQRNINEFARRDRGQPRGARRPAGLVRRAAAARASSPERYRVSLDYPEITPFMERATRRDLRETLFRKNWNKAVEANRPLLAEALALRRRIAALLGPPDLGALRHGGARWPATRTAWRPSTTSWSRRIRAAARDGDRRDRRACMRRRRASTDAAALGLAATTTRASQLAQHGIDQNEVAEYLPLDRVWTACSRSPARCSGSTTARSPTRERVASGRAAVRDPRSRPAASCSRQLLRRSLPARRQVQPCGGLPADRARPPAQPTAATSSR